MTATTTTGTRRALTRTVVLAGLAATGTAALSLPFAPTAHASGDQGAGVEKTAQRGSAAVAVTPQDAQKLGKAPDQSTTPHHTPAKPGKPGDAQGEKGTKGEQAEHRTGQGRGAQYRADGTLVTIPKEDQPAPKPASPQQIDRWIDQALKVMKKNDIPGSYEGIHRNLMRESGGDPQTINLWDVNAKQNIPSKGLLQVIDPTFQEYHVKGTKKDPFDPVANIAAASHYAADRYGSMDNVDSAY